MTIEELKTLIDELNHPNDPWKKDLVDIRRGLVFLLNKAVDDKKVVELDEPRVSERLETLSDELTISTGQEQKRRGRKKK